MQTCAESTRSVVVILDTHRYNVPLRLWQYLTGRRSPRLQAPQPDWVQGPAFRIAGTYLLRHRTYVFE